VCKNWFKNSHPFGKKCQKAAGGDFFLTHTVGVEHLLMPAQLTGTHWAMTGMIWCLALTVWDVCLKLSCFQSTSTHSALEASHFMRYINSQVTYLLTYLLTYQTVYSVKDINQTRDRLVCFSWINSHRSRQTSIEADKPLALRTLANLQTCLSSSLYVIWLLSSGSLPSLSITHQSNSPINHHDASLITVNPLNPSKTVRFFRS